jgi:hypothetical protein
MAAIASNERLHQQPRPGGEEEIEDYPPFVGAPFFHDFPAFFLGDSMTGAQILWRKGDVRAEIALHGQNPAPSCGTKLPLHIRTEDGGELALKFLCGHGIISLRTYKGNGEYNC